ncbi:TPA: fatty acid desaturase, partial [Acinetobacter baumannii]|nr:fatty acid desaturase [Acinetobacter baumannii]HBI2355547.1 fatty acid desaturase [Acinetobacter baumannii]HBI2540724.1 fatty acid desaturase [Acinetobacter baumannii]HBI2544776.1 fatty acid desaturase [Acinetobacter baumannii]HCQ5184576.1 fatty acid desaturase [Acinetobacter baumannii]
MTDSEKTEHIKKVVTAEGVALRKRHPILNHQNAIGAMILFISLVGMIATAVLYINH